MFRQQKTVLAVHVAGNVHWPALVRRLLDKSIGSKRSARNHHAPFTELALQ